MTTDNGIGRRGLLAAAAGVAALGVLGAPARAAGGKVGPYRYPITPGTPQWASLNNQQEMVDAAQLPDGLAEKMATDDLLTTVLAYPLLAHALAADDPRAGLQTVLGRSKAAQELLHRPDAAAAMLRRYSAFDPSIPATATPLQAGRRTIDAWRLEALLSLPAMLAAPPRGHLKALLRVGRAHLDAKSAHAGVYGANFLGGGATADLLHGTLTRAQTGTADGCGRTDGPVSIAAVRRAVDQHLEGATIQACTIPKISDPNSVTYYYMQTPNGTNIQYFSAPSLTSSQVSCLNSDSDAVWPQATRETSATYRYNCHSYAFYSTSDSSNSRWVERMWWDKAQQIFYPNVSRYWTDGSYKQWSTPVIYYSGMRWVYWTSNQSDGGHSAIEVGTTGYLRSKWGVYGRMYHKWDYVPSVYPMGDIRQYYR
ncbi:hypothetical protein AB0C02_33010 [Micromonospora sp. NPDC048999]|uniref:hypothetical protein n=1 Tax=Micromonospora sp. NPDC048999 TaxID=3155391 RepID=UPI0033D04C91